MAQEKEQLAFLLDENVPDAVGRVLESSGHIVHYLNREDIVIRGSEDPLVARAAEMNGLILISQDGDMKRIVRESGASNGQFKKLSLIKLSCEPPDAASRIESLLSLVEFEWANSSGSDGRRIHIEVKDTVVRICR